MLIPKRDVDTTKQKFKQFKKYPLELYQKQYNIYQNELILIPKATKTNSRIIDSINQKYTEEKTPGKLGVKLDVKSMQTEPETSKNPFRKFDFSYNQYVNLPLNERLNFHLHSNIQTKLGLGVVTVTPSFSYSLRNTYYRLGMTYGIRTDYFLMASQTLSTNWSVGILVNLAERQQFSKSKVIGTLRFKNNLLYTSLGYQNSIGFKTYPVHDQDTKMFLNPYYGGKNQQSFSTGISKRISESARLKLEIGWTPWIIQFKSTVLLKLNDWIKLFLEYEIQNTNAMINFGFKIKNFYIGIPLLSLDIVNREDIAWLTPIVFGITGLAIFWEKIRKRLPFLKGSKTEEKTTVDQKAEGRQNQLRLISRRVREIFTEENKKQGLVITEAYYGPKDLIENLIGQSQFDKLNLLSSSDYQHKVLDVTDPLRFYVDSSKLHIPKGLKTGLYGFYELDLSEDIIPCIYVRYTYQGKEEEKFVLETDSINLP